MDSVRGAVVRGPDLFADHDHRPYVRLSNDSHPFSDEEALYAAITSTGRSKAIAISADDFERGGLPRSSYVNPWTIVSIRHADIADEEGRLLPETTETIAEHAARYIGAL